MKHLFHIFCALALVFSSHGQNYLGYGISNYAGVNGIDMNPSYVVDSRYSVDMILFGANVGAQNNLVSLRKGVLKPFRSDAGEWLPNLTDPQFDKKYVVYDTNKFKTYKAQADLNLSLPVLNFMISKERWGIALTSRVRTILNVDGLDNNLAKLLIKQYDYPSVFVNNISNKTLNVSAYSWGEIGLTYGHELFDNGSQYLKFGVRPKLIVGAIAGYLRVDDFQYRVLDKDNFVTLLGNFQVAASDAIKVNNSGVTQTPSLNSDLLNYGWGIDLGLSYEWRPDIGDFKNTRCYDRKYDRTKNKYKAKFDLSILDVGSVKFNKAEGSRDFTLNVNNTPISNNILEPKSIKAVGDSVVRLVRDNLATAKPVDNQFNMPLPTAIVGQADYNLWKSVYVNATLFGALHFRNRAARIHEAAYVAITPRWDYKWAGVWLPVAYNSLNRFTLGTGLRLGPVVLGTNNILPLLGQVNLRDLNVYSVLRIPILYGKGRCKKKAEKPVPVTTPVISDTDRDSIPDNVDKCPLVFGTKALNGCPDRDADLITDSLDACPDDKGLAQFKGCPDKDGDKIIDKDDKCPDVAGLDSLQGCPFTDKDLDGLRDQRDQCPEVVGPKENNGCPWPDTDGDKVLDKDDACPKTAGTIANKGCPEIKAEEKKIIEKAFASLEFATAKDIIKPKSLPSLTQLAALLKKNPSYILKLSGHTDNQGKPDLNMILSEKRAKAVQKFLIAKGVTETNIIAEWFGQTMPIADNTTPQGRQKNRRVEMKILFQ